jgi:hypothetical protein
MRPFIATSVFVLSIGLVAGSANAQDCAFSGYGTPAIFTAHSYGALGDSTNLLNDGFVPVLMASGYATPYVLDLGVWVDDSFVNATPDAPAIVLSYIDHLNCIYALGDKINSTDDVNEISFRIHEDRIKLSSNNTPNVPGTNGLWAQQFHADFYDEIQSQGAPADLNVLFTTRPLIESDTGTAPWYGIGGASNGVGQGQSLVGVDPNLMTNGPNPHNEDWWGDIAAHELGHAMGVYAHTPRWYDVMCCSGPDYGPTERFFTPSNEFSICTDTMDAIVENSDEFWWDYYADPWASTPNPVTNVTWDYRQIGHFLITYAWKLEGDVFLAYSRGEQFQGYGWKVHDWFCIADETCAVGDVNGDGIDELIAFGRGGEMNVYLAATNGYVYTGYQFVVARNFCADTQVCRVADIDGDGAADLIAFTPHGTNIGKVYVMLNRGDGTFDGIVREWHSWFCINYEQCEVADMNADNKADLVAFDHNGKVYVALSTGYSFSGHGAIWHGSFCYGNQVCRLGDVNGDNRTDLIAFSRSAPENVGDVWVSLASPRRSRLLSFWGLRRKHFRPAKRWHDWFCINDEQCEVAEVTGDNRADIIAFSRGETGDVYVATAGNRRFTGQGVKWHDFFCVNDETCLMADADGDGRKDVLSFVK